MTPARRRPSAVRLALAPRFALSLALVMLLAVALPASAQTDRPRQQQADRLYRGLFGVTPLDPNRYQSLELRFSLLGGYDDNAVAEASGPGANLRDPRFGRSGGLGQGTAILSYLKTRNQNWVSAGVRGGFRYFQNLEELNASDYAANVGFSARTSRRTRLSGSQDIAYQPFLSLSFLPVAHAAPGVALPSATGDYAFTERPSIAYNSAISGVYDVTRRTHLSLGYSFQGFDVTASGEEGRLRHHVGRLGVNRAFTRRLTVGGSYVYGNRDGSYTGPPALSESNQGELSIDYRRSLRRQREFSLQFTAGYAEVATRSAGRDRWLDRQMTGSGRLRLDVGRAWTLASEYRRGFRNVPAIAEPVLSNDVRVEASGFPARRLEVSFSAEYSNGDTGFSNVIGLESTAGTAQFRWTVSRFAALTGNYVFYRYRFPADAALPAGFGRDLDRHGVRLGAEVLLPLLGR